MVTYVKQKTGHHPLLERALKKQRIERRIALSVPNYLGIGLIVYNTDMLVIVPPASRRHSGERKRRQNSSLHDQIALLPSEAALA